MALLGVLSLGQIVFLPGYLLLRALRLGTGVVATCVLSFALSLVVNHVLVAGLVVLGLYRPAVVYAVFAAELGLWLAVDHRWLWVSPPETIAAWRQRSWAFVQNILRSGADMPLASPGGKSGEFPGLTPGARLAFVAAALLVIGGFALSGIAQAGQIFQQWDAVVSWNRWAVDWAANRLPYATSIYPQLLPTNISLTYVFMQSSEVWVFAKAFQFLFCLLLLLAILDLARIEGKFGHVPSVVITYALLVAVLRFRMLSSGYADVPLAFFGLASVYVLMLARNVALCSAKERDLRGEKGDNDKRQRAKFLIVGALLAAGAGLTKQTGLYFTVIYPLLAWRIVLYGTEAGGLRKHLRLLTWLWLIMGMLVLPWYVYKYFDFRAGNDSNNTVLLMVDFHQGRDLLQRLIHAGDMLAEALTPVGAVLLLIAVAASLRDPLQRWLVSLIAAPLALVWTVAFSYDLRNLAVIIPWIGSAAGIGAMQIISWLASLQVRAPRGAFNPDGAPAKRVAATEVLAARRRRWLRVKRIVSMARSAGGGQPRTRHGIGGLLRIGHVVGLLTLLLITASLCVSNEMLLTWQRRQQRTVGIPELNAKLYAYSASHSGQVTIATDYQAMRWLPELGPRSVVCTCHEFSAFRQTFDRPDVHCVLVRKESAVADVCSFLETETAARLIFENHGFALYEKRASRFTIPAGSMKIAAWGENANTTNLP